MTPEEYKKWEELLLNEILATCGRYKEEVGLTRMHIAGVLAMSRDDVLDPSVIFEPDEDLLEDDDEL